MTAKRADVPDRRPILRVAGALLLLIATVSAAAQPAPVVSGVSPVAMSRGQTLEVTVSGANLSTIDTVDLPDGRGVEVELAGPPAAKGDSLRLRVTAAADAVPGEREFRLVAPTGVSAPLKVRVEQYPAVAEVEPNHAPAQPQAVQGPAVVGGKIEPGGDADAFRIRATKGQTLVVNVYAARLRSALDPAVVLYDAAGKEVAANNDADGPDSFLAYPVPADGDYTLELRDLRYRGGGNFNYRLEVGAIPYLTGIEPMAGQRGKIVDLRLLGHNLQGADKRRVDLTYAASGPVALRAQSPLGAYSNELPFEVTDLPPTIEAEPNDDAARAADVAMAADVTGLIGRPGDVDFYRLRVARKTVVHAEVLGRRLSSPIDALLTLHAANGDAIDRNDDAAGADARISPRSTPASTSCPSATSRSTAAPRSPTA